MGEKIKRGGARRFHLSKSVSLEESHGLSSVYDRILSSFCSTIFVFSFAKFGKLICLLALWLRVREEEHSHCHVCMLNIKLPVV